MSSYAKSAEGSFEDIAFVRLAVVSLAAVAAVANNPQARQKDVTNNPQAPKKKKLTASLQFFLSEIHNKIACDLLCSKCLSSTRLRRDYDAPPACLRRGLRCRGVVETAGKCQCQNRAVTHSSLRRLARSHMLDLGKRST
jgi:hypothetical protein